MLDRLTQRPASVVLIHLQLARAKDSIAPMNVGIGRRANSAEALRKLSQNHSKLISTIKAMDYVASATNQ
jgi:hypothetical protein